MLDKAFLKENESLFYTYLERTCAAHIPIQMPQSELYPPRGNLFYSKSSDC